MVKKNKIFGAFLIALPIFITIILAVFPVDTAKADAIIETDNDFYRRNSAYCVYLGRNFIINNDYDAVSVLTEPGVSGAISELEAGTVAFAEYSCLYDGEFWVYLSYFDLIRQKPFTGWAKADELLVLYDYVSFYEEYSDEFFRYEGDYSAIEEAGSVIAWQWPGADAPIWTFEVMNIDYFNVEYAYIDSEGREWGYIGYMFGYRNIWVCLSDPVNPDIPTWSGSMQPMTWVSETEHTDIKLGAREREIEFTMLIVVILLVIAVVLGTVVLIKIFWKQSKE